MNSTQAWQLHDCAVEDCGVQIDLRSSFCFRHWAKLPPWLKAELNRQQKLKDEKQPNRLVEIVKRGVEEIGASVVRG